MSEYPMLRHTGGFVVMPNEAVNDTRLSFRARGILAYLLGRPPGWRFAADRIAQEGREGRDAVAAALRELTEAGYYRWTRVRADGGRVIVVTEVAALPSLMPTEPPTGTGSPGPGDPEPGVPASGEPSPMSVPRDTTESQTPPPASQVAPSKPKSKPTRTRVPEPFVLDDELIAWTKQTAPSMLIAPQVALFVDHHAARGSLMADWRRAWQTWVRRAATTRPVGNRHAGDPTAPEHAERAALL